MKKPLVLLKQEQVLETKCSQIREIQDRAIETVKFLEKKARAEMDLVNEKRKPLWDSIEAELLRKELLPKDYTRDKYLLQYDDDAIYLVSKEKDSGGFGEFLKNILT